MKKLTVLTRRLVGIIKLKISECDARSSTKSGTTGGKIRTIWDEQSSKYLAPILHARKTGTSRNIPLVRTSKNRQKVRQEFRTKRTHMKTHKSKQKSLKIISYRFGPCRFWILNFRITMFFGFFLTFHYRWQTWKSAH